MMELKARAISYLTFKILTNSFDLRTSDFTVPRARKLMGCLRTEPLNSTKNYAVLWISSNLFCFHSATPPKLRASLIRCARVATTSPLFSSAKMRLQQLREIAWTAPRLRLVI